MRRTLSFTLVVSLAGLLAFPLAAEAGKLPKNAKPMTLEEITAIYAGNSALWGDSRAYFSPDKKVKGLAGKGKKRVTYSGEWSVTDNEICMRNSPKGETKIYTDCWKWWSDGKKAWTLWSVHYDDSKPDLKSDYGTEEIKKIKKGDKVTKEYEGLGGI